MKTIQVIVGNIGTVYNGSVMKQANETYRSYVALSKLPVGRAAGEDVTMMVGGEPKKEFVGRISKSQKE
jgi:hypothetical protein